MKQSFVPIFCAVALTGMLGAGATHWWSVRQLVALSAKRPASASPAIPKTDAVASTPAVALPVAAAVPALPAATPPVTARVEAPVNKSEREFFSSLVDELKTVRQQNQDLRDQVAETNRDLMELQFRVDTHSESFRPLKVTSEPATLQSEIDGVLPPRALPVE
jgi:hypothetical protein